MSTAKASKPITWALNVLYPTDKGWEHRIIHADPDEPLLAEVKVRRPDSLGVREYWLEVEIDHGIIRRRLFGPHGGRVVCATLTREQQDELRKQLRSAGLAGGKAPRRVRGVGRSEPAEPSVQPHQVAERLAALRRAAKREVDRLDVAFLADPSEATLSALDEARSQLRVLDAEWMDAARQAAKIGGMLAQVNAALANVQEVIRS